MFHFQVFRRAEAKTFPVDRKVIKGRGYREKKGRKKEKQKKRESKILYNLQQKLAQNLAQL